MSKNDAKAGVQSQFGSNAEKYVHSKMHSKGRDLAKLLEIIQLDGHEHILDIATGGGHVANSLSPLCKKIDALDLTTEILDVARTFIESNGYTNVEFVKGDAENLSFSNETFDMITCRIAAHHFPNVLNFVKESFRTLKKDGKFLLMDNVAPEQDDFDKFYNSIEKSRDYSHHRAWKKTEWINMLEQNGFQIQELFTFEKKFIFNTWCDMMNLSTEKKAALSEYMIKSSQLHKNKFKIQIIDGVTHSFTGESILIKAAKPTE